MLIYIHPGLLQIGKRESLIGLDFREGGTFISASVVLKHRNDSTD